MIEWLENCDLYPKFFWKGRSDRTAWAACGKKREYFTLPAQIHERVFGALSFTPFQSGDRLSAAPADRLWSGFPSCYFFEPRYLKQGEVEYPSPPLSLSLQNRSDLPDRAVWGKNVEATRDLIQKGELKKAVLARITTFSFEAPLSPWNVVRHLLETARRATVFAFQPSPSVLFLGASPEHLYTRSGRSLFTEAVAGTCSLGVPDEELLHSAKDRLEFTVVKEAIFEALHPLTTEMHWLGEDTLVKTTAVKHIYNRLHATLKEGVFDRQLIEILHPTPAMGGSPKGAALQWISTIEPFERGLYASPIGWIDPEGAEFAVGIRSALIRENRLHLFTGAGIVADSNSQKEWEEIELKMRPFIPKLSCEFCTAHD